MSEKKGHHSRRNSLNQRLGKDSRDSEPKRWSWWQSRRVAPTTTTSGKKLSDSQEQAENIRFPGKSPSPTNLSLNLAPAQTGSEEIVNSIRLSDIRGSEPLPTQRTTKSEAGASVRSNLKNLSIGDQRTTQPPSPPVAAARTKRPADPIGQTPEGGDVRPAKRQGAAAHTVTEGQMDHSPYTNIQESESTDVAVNGQPDLVHLPQPLATRGAKSANSRSAHLPFTDTHQEPEVSKMLLQPDTRPITQDQLVNEVKGIYAGLVMVEKKCVEIDLQQSKTMTKLSDEQWQALIALHRTLLYEHHDFFLASQHPSSSPALRRLATKYAMPARMWRHGIHSFLELLRHRLPDSLDHMLAFVYLAYSMMALLKESVPAFVETWIECLGDLARYRMAIEEVDLKDREIWSGCAKLWYEQAADKSPNVGRIQHHLAVLARPNIVQQLCYYSKALTSVIPFQNAKDSVMLLFNPFLQDGENTSQKYIAVEAAFITFHGVLFTLGHWKPYWTNLSTYLSGLDAHIGRTGPKFRIQGPEMILVLCAAAYNFGNNDARLVKIFQKDTEKRGAQTATPKDSQPFSEGSATGFILDDDRGIHFKAEPCDARDVPMDGKISDPELAAAQAVRALGQTTGIVTKRIGDKNIVPFMHILMAFLWSLLHVPGALLYVEREIQWDGIVTFLNTLGRSGVDESRVNGESFPVQLSAPGRQLPEDFYMRGSIWAQFYHPAGFFSGPVVDEDERTLDMPSHAPLRAERILWIAIQFAAAGRWFSYDKKNRKFTITEYAASLATSVASQAHDSSSNRLSIHLDNDVRMVEAPSASQ